MPSKKQRQGDELQRLREEITRLRLARRGVRREAPRIKYYFVRADKVRETTATTLPALQTMLADAKMREVACKHDRIWNTCTRSW